MSKKRPSIRPIYSKKPSRNVYEYWDDKEQKYTKCAGFVIDIWDGETDVGWP
ncbi:hypothetical protein ACFL6Q_00560 [Candidatus Neomarinimicrobiota bacterium]